MRINKKTRNEGHYHGLEDDSEKVKPKKKWPKDVPIKNFRPLGPTEKTADEEKYNIDVGLS